MPNIIVAKCQWLVNQMLASTAGNTVSSKKMAQQCICFLFLKVFKKINKNK